MDEQQQKALGKLMALYPQTIVGDLGALVWGHYLSEVPGDALGEIVDGWVTSETKPPTIADLLERWRARSGRDAESVWQLLVRIVRNGEWRDRTKQGGPERAFGFTGNPALEESVRAAGGWSAFGRATEQDTVWLKKAFMEAYHRAAVVHDARLQLAMGENPRLEALMERIGELDEVKEINERYDRVVRERGDGGE